MPITRRWPKRAPRGDFTADCDVCGVAWRRSQLVHKADGRLCCPDDVRGRDTVTLSEGNAMAAANRRGPAPRVGEGGTFTLNQETVPDISTKVPHITFGNGSGH